MLSEKALQAAVDAYTDEEFIDAVIHWLSTIRSLDFEVGGDPCNVGAMMVSIYFVEHLLKAYRKKKFGDKPIVTI